VKSTLSLRKTTLIMNSTDEQALSRSLFPDRNLAICLVGGARLGSAEWTVVLRTQSPHLIVNLSAHIRCETL
jgi:hypothetical protein